MTLKSIPFDRLRVRSHALWADQWMLLTAGDFASGRFNAMAVAWGSIGVMWETPFVQVVVRPTRHTHGFMERFDTFTLCAFPEPFRKAVSLLGSKSGRDGDKIAESGLTPVPSQHVAAPAFAEAELVFECRKMYWDDFDPSHFLKESVHSLYPARDYHRMYFGEVVHLLGTDAFV